MAKIEMLLDVHLFRAVLAILGLSASKCSIVWVAFWVFIHVRMAIRQVDVQCRPMLAINIYFDSPGKK